MNIKKYSIRFIMIILAINLVFFIYFFNFNLVVFNNEQFFIDEFKKYGVFEKFPNDNISKINENVLIYLNNKEDIGLIDEGFFNKKEKQHLLDVKNVFNRASYFNNYLIILSLFLLLLLYMLIYLKESEKWLIGYFNRTVIKQFSKKILYIFFMASILTLFSLFTIWLSIKLNFNFAFDLMHKLLFTEGSWLFDPSENIINVYTLGFFYDIPLKILMNIFYTSLIINFICIPIFKYDRINSNN